MIWVNLFGLITCSYALGTLVTCTATATNHKVSDQLTKSDLITCFGLAFFISGIVLTVLNIISFFDQRRNRERCQGGDLRGRGVLFKRLTSVRVGRVQTFLSKKSLKKNLSKKSSKTNPRQIKTTRGQVLGPLFKLRVNFLRLVQTGLEKECILQQNSPQRIRV